MIKFISKEHEDYYKEKQLTTAQSDSYHRALFYVIGLNPDTRNHDNRIYDVKNREIRPECLEDAWQTGGSMRVCLFAFNLFNGFVYPDSPCKSTPENLFDSEYAPYFTEALSIRFPYYL